MALAKSAFVAADHECRNNPQPSNLQHCTTDKTPNNTDDRSDVQPAHRRRDARVGAAGAAGLASFQEQLVEGRRGRYAISATKVCHHDSVSHNSIKAQTEPVAVLGKSKTAFSVIASSITQSSSYGGFRSVKDCSKQCV